MGSPIGSFPSVLVTDVSSSAWQASPDGCGCPFPSRGHVHLFPLRFNTSSIFGVRLSKPSHWLPYIEIFVTSLVNMISDVGVHNNHRTCRYPIHLIIHSFIHHVSSLFIRAIIRRPRLLSRPTCSSNPPIISYLHTYTYLPNLSTPPSCAHGLSPCIATRGITFHRQWPEAQGLRFRPCTPKRTAPAPAPVPASASTHFSPHSAALTAA